MTPIRILIADDHPIVRRGMKSLLELKPSLKIVGEAEDGLEAVEKARDLKPDVILLDLMMPRMSGLETIEAIKAEDPNARILVVTSFADDNNVLPAIKAGARGYLLKDANGEMLLQAITDVYNGQSSLHPTIARKLIDEINQPPTNSTPKTEDPLSVRETEVLKYVAQGLSNQEIAAELVISEGTVRIHVSNILSKLHLASRTQATLYALKEGLANLD